MADLCDRFREEHLPRKRPYTQRDYRRMLALIMPALGRIKVADVNFSEVDRLHRRMSQRAPYEANRCVAVSQKCSVWRSNGNIGLTTRPKGIERNDEVKRERFLSADELQRLGDALAKHKDKAAANIFRLLLLTGSARSGEVRAARWDQFDLPDLDRSQPTRHKQTKRTAFRSTRRRKRVLLANCARWQPTAPSTFPAP